MVNRRRNLDNDIYKVILECSEIILNTAVFILSIVNMRNEGGSNPGEETTINECENDDITVGS